MNLKLAQFKITTEYSNLGTTTPQTPLHCICTEKKELLQDYFPFSSEKTGECNNFTQERRLPFGIFRENKRIVAEMTPHNSLFPSRRKCLDRLNLHLNDMITKYKLPQILITRIFFHFNCPL